MTDDTITLIALADRPAWELATRAALPGQSWGHAAGLAADGYKPELAVVRAQGAKLILPFHRRDADGAVDIATLPGLSGALVTGDTFAPFAAWSRFAARQGWVAGYIQLSPENDALLVPPPDVCKTSNVLYVFDSHDWSIETSIGHNMRRNLKAGDRIGALLVTDLPALSDVFPALYCGHLARVGGRAEFGDKALGRWFSEPGIVAFGAQVGGQIVNVQMGRRHGEWADLHLAGTTPEGRDLQAWVIWQAIEHLRRDGVRFFNIGGYGQPGDGLHWMKARFGAVEHPLRAVCQIYDPDRYARLCQQTGTTDDGGFFPAYRAALRAR